MTRDTSAGLTKHPIVVRIDEGVLRGDLVIPGGAHGMCTTMADRINAALLDFARS